MKRKNKVWWVFGLLKLVELSAVVAIIFVPYWLGILFPYFSLFVEGVDYSTPIAKTMSLWFGGVLCICIFLLCICVIVLIVFLFRQGFIKWFRANLKWAKKIVYKRKKK